MSIPTNITQEDLLQAIEKIDKEGIPLNGHSSTYDLKYNNKRYPPKVVVSYGNLFANGEELNRSSFSDGIGTLAFELLEKRGFKIVPKKVEEQGFYDQLQKFLKQAQTDNLKYNHFSRTYQDLKVRVSFGQGYPARIPWISFLKEPNTTSEGIYPVYLYYKNNNRLILAYGVSETKKPPYQWNLNKTQTIKSYFNQQQLAKPVRYGDSYVFKTYDVKNLPDAKTMNHDLDLLIAEYKSVTNEKPEPITELNIFSTQDRANLQEPQKEPLIQQEFNPKLFQSHLTASGLRYAPTLITRFIGALLTKPFVILTGLSGSGKTKLAQAFAQWISASNNQYCLVPVGADWTNREPLLGYPNALDPSGYIKPDNGVLDLLMRAEQNPQKPHFLILDEMNLSHVERYFADFLSVMESKDDIPLYATGSVKYASSNGNNTNEAIPSSLTLPNNLFLIGTVNIDETTNMFSPKVLDRANTIEFRVTQEEMTAFLRNIRDIDMSQLENEGASMGSDFLQQTRNKDFPQQDLSEINRTLIDFFEQLSKTGAEFGYRSATEILRLIQQLSQLDATLSTYEKLDIAIMQKLLPKLHGSRRKLAPVLSTLASFCLISEIKNVEKEVLDKEEFKIQGNPQVLFPLSLNKIKRMYQGALSNGFASFAEA